LGLLFGAAGSIYIAREVKKDHSFYSPSSEPLNMQSFLIILFSLLFAVQASPLWSRASDDVFNPTITAPNKDTIWILGEDETVTWYVNIFVPESLHY
jgi:hypothetical protein